MKVDVNFNIGADFFEIDDDYIKSRIEESDLCLDEVVSEYFEDAVSRIEGCVDNHFPGGLRTFEVSSKYDIYFDTFNGESPRG